MCLKKVEVPKKKSGLGWKLVRTTNDPGVYIGQWPYMGVYSGGALNKDSGGYPVYERYRIGEKTVPLSTTMIEFRSVRYESGIHVYLRKADAQMEKTKRLYSHQLTLLRCKYSNVYATDGTVVVCKEVTPIKAY